MLFLGTWCIGKAPYTTSSFHSLGFVRLAQNDSIFEVYTDPSSVCPLRNGFRRTCVRFQSYHLVNSVFTVSGLLLEPVNTVVLNACFQSVKGVRQFVQASPWNGYVIEHYGELGEAETDEEIEAAIRNNVISIWYPSCTARMSAHNAAHFYPW
ncbi:hypothetical protein DFS33DRAFT_833686 [Desarmillaria ectypa]|nr:hypothetical protein DFS33DRAFT_833686 [Desarmillaria ectypa]